jgi:hypothetical protein
MEVIVSAIDKLSEKSLKNDHVSSGRLINWSDANEFTQRIARTVYIKT